VSRPVLCVLLQSSSLGRTHVLSLIFPFMGSGFSFSLAGDSIAVKTRNRSIRWKGKQSMDSPDTTLQHYLDVNTHSSYYELSDSMRVQVNACITRLGQCAFFGLHPSAQASLLDRTANLVLTCIALLHQDPLRGKHETSLAIPSLFHPRLNHRFFASASNLTRVIEN